MTLDSEFKDKEENETPSAANEAWQMLGVLHWIFEQKGRDNKECYDKFHALILWNKTKLVI